MKVGAEIQPDRKVAPRSEPKPKAKAETEAPPETKAAPEAEARTKAETRTEAKPKVKAEAETESETKAEAPPKKKASPKSSAASGTELDLSTIKLPKVGDMAEFLAQIDNESDIEALRARDSRKTAQPHYEARLAELSGSAKGKKG